MNLKVTKKLALVTGASRGIGRAIAQELAKQGARIIIVARNAESLNDTLESLEGTGHLAFAVDLMAPDGVDQLAKLILDSADEPDILIHNLGGSAMAFQAMAPSSEWERVWRFNVGIGHELNRIFIPAMVKKQWGRIIHLSTLSTSTYNGYAPYVSAKCALDGYVKTMSRQISKDNVIMSAVAPGAIYSEGRHFAKLQAENPAALEQYFKEHLPIGRLGTGEDVASAVAYLCSEQASFMAGAIMSVDGGGM
jgi:NAD(P)-dependent dehydrogenase (short-subunit alcohol dehydrogenase family)